MHDQATVTEEVLDPEGVLRRWDTSVIKSYLKRIWMAMHGKSDRGPEDYDPFADERGLLHDIIRKQTHTIDVHRQGGNGVGNIQSPKYGWLINAVIVVILGLSAWNLKATIENTTAIAVLQCQINPTCSQAVRRGTP